MSSLSGPKLEELVHVFGVRRTFEILLNLGGRRHYVAGKRASHGGELSSFLTPDELTKLAERWGGVFIRLGLHRGFCIHFMRRVEGRPLAQCARALKMTEKGVYDGIRRPLPPTVEAAIEREAAKP